MFLCSLIWRKEWWTAFMQNVSWVTTFSFSNCSFFIFPTYFSLLYTFKLHFFYWFLLCECLRHSLYYWLCHGWAWKIGTEVSCGFKVTPFMSGLSPLQLHCIEISLTMKLSFRIAKDPRFERLPCIHKGTYADDCIVDRVTQVF